VGIHKRAALLPEVALLLQADNQSYSCIIHPSTGVLSKINANRFLNIDINITGQYLSVHGRKLGYMVRLLMQKKAKLAS